MSDTLIPDTVVVNAQLQATEIYVTMGHDDAEETRPETAPDRPHEAARRAREAHGRGVCPDSADGPSGEDARIRPVPSVGLSDRSVTPSIAPVSW